ncbi:neuritin isoform X1 [Elephas maximus indicus]|uniref:neuritin isoform X1 n=1 Tax=Elephas maximus indicus TaxID=99487 RepID=UPI0021163167|nr:neuritin isoform X1 [Elephas maximus indicus]
MLLFNWILQWQGFLGFRVRRTGKLTTVYGSARAEVEVNPGPFPSASRSGLESTRPASPFLKQFANGASSEAASASVTFPLDRAWLGARGQAAAERGVGKPYLVQAVRAAGKCDAVFKGFSDCLLKLGDSMANYPQGLDDKTNIQTVCTYWEDFHSCTVTALTDCQEGAKDMWDKLRKESKNLNIQGSLFELCGSGNGAAGSLLPALPVLLVSLTAALATWLSF